MLKERRLKDQTWENRTINYVIDRQNLDGGYSFCQGTESNAQDTYYGLATLSLLKTEFPTIKNTKKFINESRLNSIYAIYYVAKASLLLGDGVDLVLKRKLAPILKSNQYFGSTDFFSEVSSEFTTTFMALELSRILKLSIETKPVVDWLLKFRNPDSGFGQKTQSNINSTYYALACLNLLGKKPMDLHKTASFVRKCEKPYGGFTVVPLNFIPYMEHTYCGVMALDLLGEKNRFLTQTENWILNCQKKNGGFGRSDLGISTFSNTYYAIEVLNKLAHP